MLGREQKLSFTDPLLTHREPAFPCHRHLLNPALPLTGLFTCFGGQGANYESLNSLLCQLYYYFTAGSPESCSVFVQMSKLCVLVCLCLEQNAALWKDKRILISNRSTSLLVCSSVACISLTLIVHVAFLFACVGLCQNILTKQL